jgi:hypothetical protein
MSEKEKRDKKSKTVDDVSESESEDVNEEENEVTEEDDDERVPIDLSENEIYRGICTLFEDEDGNNILEYISLLHTELIGINKSLENLRLIRKDITRIADCAELFFKVKKTENKSEQTSESVIKKKTK